MPFKEDDEQTKLWAKMGGETNRREMKIAQEVKMAKAIDKGLNLHEKVADGIATDEEIKRYNNIEKRELKYLDKIHATQSSTDITTKGESINLTPEALALAKKYEEDLNKLEDKE